MTHFRLFQKGVIQLDTPFNIDTNTAQPTFANRPSTNWMSWHYHGKYINAYGSPKFLGNRCLYLSRNYLDIFINRSLHVWRELCLPLPLPEWCGVWCLRRQLSCRLWWWRLARARGFMVHGRLDGIWLSDGWVFVQFIRFCFHVNYLVYIVSKIEDYYGVRFIMLQLKKYLVTRGSRNLKAKHQIAYNRHPHISSRGCRYAVNFEVLCMIHVFLLSYRCYYAISYDFEPYHKGNCLWLLYRINILYMHVRCDNSSPILCSPWFACKITN